MDTKNELFSHVYWFQNSNRLKYSADILIEKLNLLIKEEPFYDSQKWIEYNDNIKSLLETNFLLIGYSIENLFKGLLIYQYLKHNILPENCNFSFIKKNIWEVKDIHNLLEFAGKANFHISQSETDLLSKLTDFVKWNGRYHIPKDSKGIENIRNSEVGHRFTSEDQILVNNLIQRVKKLID